MTIIRLLELQAWPTFSIRVAQAVSAASSTSGVSRMMYGSDPPSSRTTFLRLRPACAATTVPARSEPVSETPRSRGSAIIVGDLLVGGEDVRVHALGHAGVLHDLRDRQGRGGAVLRVLDDDGVADDQGGGGEPGHLVIRVVPRHHAEHRADRQVLHPRGIMAGQRPVGEQRGAVVDVVLEDGGAELGLTDGLRGPLAHLLGDQRGQVGGALGEQLGDPLDDRGALGDRPPLPFRERLGGGAERALDLGVRGVGEGLRYLAGRGVGHLIGRSLRHCLLPESLRYKIHQDNVTGGHVPGPSRPSTSAGAASRRWRRPYRAVPRSTRSPPRRCWPVRRRR